MTPSGVTPPAARRPTTVRVLLANSASQILGRLLLSVSRLAMAMLIVRLAGSGSFGEYALMLSFLAVLEWMVDFGQTDLAVRDISRDDTAEGVMLGALAWLKLIQGLVMMPLLPLALWLIGYPAAFVRAGMIGSLGVPFVAAVLVFRARFKTHMHMGRDVLAELAGVAAMLPATWFACVRGAGIEGLVAAYLFGRIVMALAALVLLRGLPPVRLGGAIRAAGWLLLRQAIPLGLIGLMVGIYDALAPVILSRLTDLQEVAEYAGASRYVFLVVIVVQALNTAFFPMLSRAWPHAPQRMVGLQQMAVDVSVMLSVGMICGLYAAADFLMGLLGPGLLSGVEVLRWMCSIVLVRTISTAMSPLIIIAGRQSQAAWLTLTSLTLQVAALLVLVPRYGAMGAVVSCMIVEFLTGAIAISWVGQRVSDVWLRWSVPLRLMACGIIAIGLTSTQAFFGTLGSGIVCGLLYVALSFATGAISLARIRGFVQEMQVRRAGVVVPAAAREP